MTYSWLAISVRDGDAPQQVARHRQVAELEPGRPEVVVASAATSSAPRRSASSIAGAQHRQSLVLVVDQDEQRRPG